MKRFIATLSAMLLFAAASGRSEAGPMISLSSPDDLTHLTLGERVTIDVTLSGLDVGNDFIFVLNTKVLFPSSVFQPIPDPNNSSGLKPGTILSLSTTLPDVPQTSNFNALSSLTPGQAIGNFSDSFPSLTLAINQNGLYYSFILQAIGAGTGQISFDTSATAYRADSTNHDLVPLPTGGSLSFDITPAPEPASLTLLGIGLASLTGYGWRRRFRTGR
jgi:hypothetical protein